MNRIAIASTVVGFGLSSSLLLAQTPPAGRGNAGTARRSFEKFTVEGQPIDRRPPELDTDHPVFPGQTHAPYHKTTDVAVTTIAGGLDNPWAVALLPSGRFLVTEKPGRIRILNKDGSALHTITANMPPVYFRGQAGLLDVALDRNFASNHRIFFIYMRVVDADTCVQAIDSATLNEDEGTLSNVHTIFQGTPFTNRAVSQTGARIAIDPKDGNLFVAIGDRSTGDPLPLQAQHTDKYLGKVIHITPEGKPAPGNPSIGLPEVWTMGHRTPQGLTFAPDGRLWEVEHGPRGGDELNLIEPGKNYGWPLVSYANNYDGVPIPSPDTRPDLTKPVIYWTPVIAPGSLTFYNGALFPQWKGSALIGGMGTQSLNRITFDGKGGATAAERWDVGHRIRDVAIAPDGAVWMLEDANPGGLFRVTPKSGSSTQ